MVAEDGGEGLSQSRRGPIDLAITDRFMPDIDGLELIRTLKREQPPVPIIAISAGGELGQARLLDVAERLGSSRSRSTWRSCGRRSDRACHRRDAVALDPHRRVRLQSRQSRRPCRT